MSICALCACRVSCWRYGPACWLMYAERSRSNGIWSGVTPVIVLPRSVTRTCTVPYWLSTGSPSTVRVAPFVVVGPDAFGGTPVPGCGGPVEGLVPRLGVTALAVGFGATLGDDLKDASAPRPIIVMTMAGTARRIIGSLRTRSVRSG